MYRISANVVNGHTFTVINRYSFTDSKILGRGSFGVVATALDTETNKVIAIKRIRPYCNDDWDARHTLREILLMRLLGPHPNIISLYNLSIHHEKSELYMMIELMDCDLHRVIQSKQPLTPKHFKCFLKQILEAIKAMHEVGVFHRDLKPGNILVSKDCQLRITDFGLARFMDETTRSGQNNVNPMTEYVVTRWYRAPEILLSPQIPYDEAIDLWSIGCILAELYRRKPLFPGKSHANQVQLIFEVMGYSSSRSNNFGFPLNSEAQTFLERKCQYEKQPITSVVPNLTDDAKELIEHLLSVNPAKRPSAVEALNFAYLSNADIICDYSKKYVIQPTNKHFEFEKEKYHIDELREMINDEVKHYQEDSATAFKNQSDNHNSPLRSTRNETFRYTRDELQQQVKSRESEVESTAKYQSNENVSYNQFPNANSHGQYASALSRQNSASQHDENNVGPASQLRTTRSFPNQQSLNNISSNKSDSNGIVRSGSGSSSIRGMAVGSIIASARNMNATSPAPRTPKTPSNEQINNILNKSNKCLQRAGNNIGGSSQHLPSSSTNQRVNTSSVNPFSNKSLPRQLDPLPIPPYHGQQSNQHPPQPQMQHSNSLFSSLQGRYNYFNSRNILPSTVRPASGGNVTENTNNSMDIVDDDTNGGIAENRRITTAPPAVGYGNNNVGNHTKLSNQVDSMQVDGVQQAKKKTLLNFPTFSKR